MVKQKLFRWMHKIALFAIVFASLAPSISHALSSHNDPKGFIQEICSAGGKKLYIQVVTTQGKQLQAELDVKPGSQPVSINHHMDHCPFCHAGLADLAIPSRNPAFELYLAQQDSKQHFDYITPIVPHYIQTAHPTRAPPTITL
jgi:hypothetical protein